VRLIDGAPCPARAYANIRSYDGLGPYRPRRDLDAYLALTDPEVEFTPYEVWVQGGEPRSRR
jgi:hypothetical protein